MRRLVAVKVGEVRLPEGKGKGGEGKEGKEGKGEGKGKDDSIVSKYAGQKVAPAPPGWQPPPKHSSGSVQTSPSSQVVPSATSSAPH